MNSQSEIPNYNAEMPNDYLKENLNYNPNLRKILYVSGFKNNKNFNLHWQELSENDNIMPERLKLLREVYSNIKVIEVWDFPDNDIIHCIKIKSNQMRYLSLKYDACLSYYNMKNKGII